MDKKIEEARDFLIQIGMPKQQQSDLCCYVLLAMADIRPNMGWDEATGKWIRIHDIIQFTSQYYGVDYAENSRETFRKQAMHSFRTAALVEDNGEATNSPNYRYRLTVEALRTMQAMETEHWSAALDDFLSDHDKLIDIYASKRKMAMLPVKINGDEFRFSPGKHNELQKVVLEEFAPRFAPNSECFYVGDTTERDLIKNTESLRELGFEITLHDKMPDVVLYRREKDWIYFVEAVTSVGPMSPERIIELNEMTGEVNAGKIFVTAFLDFKTYKKFSEELAWDTEVWIAEIPDHMIHMNGDKLLEPRN